MTLRGRPPAGVILAAGRSSRMGRPKALLPLGPGGGEPIVVRLVRVFRESGLDPIIVVASGATSTALAGHFGVRVVEGEPDAPMIDSLARALEGLENVPSAVVQPVDAPFTSSTMIAALLAGGAAASRVPVYDGRPGHPVLVGASLFDQVRTRPEGGLRRILAEAGAEPVAIPDPRILADLDTPEDLEAWRAWIG